MHPESFIYAIHSFFQWIVVRESHAALKPAVIPFVLCFLLCFDPFKTVIKRHNSLHFPIPLASPYASGERLFVNKRLVFFYY